MIIIDAKIFETGEIIDLCADENADVSELFPVLSRYTGKDLNGCFIVSENSRCFLSKHASFVKQGICGGDRLIII